MSKHARVLRNILALLVSQLGTWSATIIMTLVVPSYLGAQLYGLYTFVSTYVGFFAIGITLGTGTFLTWRIARQPDEASRLTVNTLYLQVPLWILWSVVALAVLPTMDTTPLTRTLVLVMLVGALFASLSSTCISGLSGFQIMRVPALISVVAALANSVAAVLCVRLHTSVVVLALSALTVQVVNLVVMLAYAHRKIRLVARLDLRTWRTLVLGGMPFFTWSVVLLFYWQVDVIMLKVMVGDTVIGWYGVANRIISIPAFLPTIVVAAILPALSHERSADSPYFRAMASRAIRLVTAVNIPASVGIILLASRITALLHFPGSFQQLAPLIIILSINTPLVALDMILGTTLIAVGRQNAWTCVGIIAAVLNPLVNLWAIPFTQHMFSNGAIGASLTTIQSEVIMFAGALLLRPKNVFTRWDVFYIFRCLVAAAVMVPAVQVFEGSGSPVNLLLSVTYGLAVYGFACYALQVITNRDLKGALVLVLAKAGMGDVSQLTLSEMFQQIGLVSARQSARGRLGRARAAISRPLRVVSRPLARVGIVISQPLVQVGSSIGSAASRYWSPTSWVEHHQHAPDGQLPQGIPEDASSAFRAGDGGMFQPTRGNGPVDVPSLPLAPLSLRETTPRVAAIRDDYHNGNGNGHGNGHSHGNGSADSGEARRTRDTAPLARQYETMQRHGGAFDADEDAVTQPRIHAPARRE